MNYSERIDKAIDYIGKHLDEKLSIDQLSQIACFSKYHFHRLFTAYTGLSLKQYIRWLRLKRAAHQLLIYKDQSILDIALSAGFESHEAFSRAFKQICGLNPSQFRETLSWRVWESPPYSVHKHSEENMRLNVTIKHLPQRRLAVYEHHGDFNKLVDSFNKLLDWAKAQPIDVKPKPGEAFGYAYNDPKEVDPADFRFDLALTIPKEVKVSGDIRERYLPEGRYAIAVHKGSLENIADTIYGLYRDWLPTSGEELDDLPCLFRYHNFEYEVAETELLTDVMLLLK